MSTNTEKEIKSLRHPQVTTGDAFNVSMTLEMASKLKRQQVSSLSLHVTDR